MELLFGIIFIVVVYCLCKSTEWKSNNRTTPPGYHRDWGKANYDITMHGKDYYHKQNLAGKYDIPDKNRIVTYSFRLK